MDAAVAKLKMIACGVWPVAVFKKTLAPWLCVCMECGEFVKPSYANVVTKGQGGCQFCAIRSKTIDPSDAKQAMIERGVWPIEKFRNTSDKWLCVCMECGEFVTPRYNSVVHKGNGGCAPCGRKEIDPVQAKAFMISKGMWPVEKFVNGNAPWLCVCMGCGEFITPRYGGTRYRGSGCKFCAQKALNPEVAKARMIKRGYWPIAKITGSHDRILCVCMKCGEFNSPRYDSVVSGIQGGCLACAKSGFKVAEPAFIYLLHHKLWKAAKVGIYNIDSGRLAKHERLGWALYRTYAFDTGHSAWLVEQKVLRTWRSRGDDWGPVLPLGTEKYDGYTETVSLTRQNGDSTSIEILWEDVMRAITQVANDRLVASTGTESAAELSS
ncbi:hypothetical protein ACFYYP_24960 [Microbispora rosea]|uniref:hypothetical protein n=1 Tax=Microbispora rosea TaxID=58117 RepID=UPI0036CD39A0